MVKNSGWNISRQTTVILAISHNIDINFIDLGKENSDLDFYTPVVIANNDLLSENPEMVKNFLLATKKGYEFCVENPEEAATILLEYAPELDSELVIESQKSAKPIAISSLSSRRILDYPNTSQQRVNVLGKLSLDLRK